MAALCLLLAVIGGILVGGLVLEDTAAGSAMVLHHPISGYSEGQLLAMAAPSGSSLACWWSGAVSLRRTRRARRRQLRTAERDLTAQLVELERENTSLREELARRDPPLRGPGEAALPADLGTASAASVAEGQARVLPMPADRHLEPVYEQAKRAAHLHSQLDR